MHAAVIRVALLCALVALGSAAAPSIAQTPPASVHACGDGLDNDGDAQRDYPADEGCASFDDDTEDTVVCRVNCFCSANPDIGGAGTGADDPEPADPSFADCPGSITGAVCPLERQECTAKFSSIVDPNTGAATLASGYVCPSSPNGTCTLDPSDHKRYCSPHVCVSKTTAPTDTVDTGGSFPDDAGPRDTHGNCLGQLSLFSGASKRCRRAGTQTAYQNCCHNKNPPLTDTVGAEGEPNQIEYRQEKTSFEFWDNQCDVQDQETSLLADSDYCIYLGTYCAETWPLVGCVQRNRSYCCFNSKLARMIQEQGRAQIPSMGGFGGAQSPHCRGFTMEEFQALDFTKIDLGGYGADIRTKGQATIQREAQDATRRRFNP